MQFNTVAITLIEKNSTTGLITFTGEVGQNPSRNGIVFTCKPTDYVQISFDRQFIQVWNGYTGIQFSVNPEITITGDPASPYAYLSDDYTSTDYQDKLNDIYTYLLSSVLEACCCPEITVVGTTVFVDTEADLPASPQENVLYVAKDQGTEWRWDGTGWRQLVVEDAAITMYSSRTFT